MGYQNIHRLIKAGGDAGDQADFTDTGLKSDVISESTSGSGVTADGVLLKDGAVIGSLATESGDTVKLFPASLTATGSVLANAAAITAITTVVTGADNTKAVALPEAAAGLTYIIVNSSTDKTLPVFPQVADKINGGTANSSISMAAASAAIFIALDETNWYTVPRTPS